jgi:hypothetical protein
MIEDESLRKSFISIKEGAKVVLEKLDAVLRSL